MHPIFSTPPGVATPPGKNIDSARLGELLAAPFPPDLIEWRAGHTSGSRAQAFAYVDARVVHRRFDEVCGVAGWQIMPYEIAPGQIGSAISIWVNGQWVTKADGAFAGDLEVREPAEANNNRSAAAKAAQEREKNAKGSISAAAKRAAGVWSVGRYLYDLGDVWEDVEMDGPRVKGFTKQAQARLYDRVAKVYFDHYELIARRHENAAAAFLVKGDLNSAHGAAEAAVHVRVRVFGADDDATKRAQGVLVDVKRRQREANGEPPVTPAAPASTTASPVTPPATAGDLLADTIAKINAAATADEVAAIARATFSRFNVTPTYRAALEAKMQTFDPTWTIERAAAAKQQDRAARDGGAPPAARPPANAKPAPAAAPKASPARPRRRAK